MNLIDRKVKRESGKQILGHGDDNSIEFGMMVNKFRREDQVVQQSSLGGKGQLTSGRAGDHVVCITQVPIRQFLLKSGEVHLITMIIAGMHWIELASTFNH